MAALNTPLPPAGMETVAGEAVRVKLEGVTVTETGTVLVKPPLVAVSKRVNVLAPMVIGVEN